MIIGRKISVQAATALLAAFTAVVLLAAAPSPAAVVPSYAWATMGGGTGSAYAHDVSGLPDGSSIITGYFTVSATFGGTTLTSTGVSDTFTAKVNADGSYAWAIRGGGTGTDVAFGVSALPDGSSIITGYFTGSATFGGTTLTSTGAPYDTFTVKVNADGSYAWAIRGGGTGTAEALGVSALPDGSSIITGSFNGTATFGTTPSLISTGSRDTFTVKVNADGSYAWAIRGGGTGSAFAMARGVSVLPDGSSIITGQFSGTATFGGTTLTSTGSFDTFTVKVNADGSYAWAIRGGGTGSDEAYGVSVLPDGSSIITGSFNGIAIFGATTLTSTGSRDTFTVKVNADGSYAWAIRGGGTGTAETRGVSALPDGSSIITGFFSGIAIFGDTTLTSTGLRDTFTAKVNADGSYAWAIRGGGTGTDEAYGVSALPDGSSIITGVFTGTATFGTTPPLISIGSNDSFTARILPRVLFDLAVSKSGTGSGTVTSSPAGIDCGSDCSETLVDGTSVTLTATPATGSSFAGWSGAGCSGTSTCTVIMSEARAVNAEFAVVPPVPPVLFNLAVSKSGTGGGTVTSSPAGINCGADCSESLEDGSSVTLTAKPTTGSSFAGWSGAGCSGTSTCTVTMSAARAVDAKFTKLPSNVFPTPKVKAGASALSSSVRVPGRGTITQRVTRSSNLAAVLTVCKASGKATKAGWVKLTCKLSAATRKALRKRSLRVSVKTTFTPTGGLPASKTQAVTLKSQRPPPYTG